VQLPTEAMEGFQRSVDWSAPTVQTRQNRTGKNDGPLTALQAVISKAGNVALGTFE